MNTTIEVEAELALLHRLSEIVNALYQDTKAERATLHRQLWEQGDDDAIDSSVLLDAEILRGNVAGIATDVPRVKSLRRDFALKALRDAVMPTTMMLWLMKAGDDYPQFAKYILANDHLRLALIEWLES